MARRAAGAVEGAMAFSEENVRATFGGAVAGLGPSRGTARRIVSHDRVYFDMPNPKRLNLFRRGKALRRIVELC